MILNNYKDYPHGNHRRSPRIHYAKRNIHCNLKIVFSYQLDAPGTVIIFIDPELVLFPFSGECNFVDSAPFETDIYDGMMQKIKHGDWGLGLN